MQTELDRIDLRMLRELQKNGRMPVVGKLAEKVVALARRLPAAVRRLEDSGVIERYAAVLSPAALGQRIQAFVRVSIERQSKDVAEAFGNRDQAPARGARLLQS